MSTKTEGKHTEEFLISEEENISREAGTLASGQTVVDGQAVKDNGSGKLVAAAGTHDTAGDSTETILGIVCGNWSVSADTTVPYIARIAAVKTSAVTYHTGGADAAKKAAVKAALKALFIISR